MGVRFPLAAPLYNGPCDGMADMEVSRGHFMAKPDDHRTKNLMKKLILSLQVQVLSKPTRFMQVYRKSLLSSGVKSVIGMPWGFESLHLCHFHALMVFLMAACLTSNQTVRVRVPLGAPLWGHGSTGRTIPSHGIDLGSNPSGSTISDLRIVFIVFVLSFSIYMGVIVNRNKYATYYNPSQSMGS